MEFAATFRVALRALQRNKMRTALTMLGIIIGVGAVIAAVAIGEGASQEVQEQIANLGDNMIWIEAGGRNVNGVRTGNWGTKSLTVGDAMAIQEQIHQVTNVSPIRLCSQGRTVVYRYPLHQRQSLRCNLCPP